MNGYLLDTNIVSASRKRELPVMRWLSQNDTPNQWLSVITLGEIERGILRKRSKDPIAAEHLASWLERLRGTYVGRLIDVDEDVALEWGRIASGRTRGEADGLIAATAIVHGLTVVTRNVRDFVDIGIPVVNPWDA